MKPYVYWNWVGVYRKLHFCHIHNDVKTTRHSKLSLFFPSKLFDISVAEYYVINIQVFSSQIDITTPLRDPSAPVKPVASLTISQSNTDSHAAAPTISSTMLTLDRQSIADPDV